MDTTNKVYRFAEIPWHDSLLKKVAIRNDGGLYGITLIIKHSTEVDISETRISFLEVRYLTASIDLLALQFCSGMIWDATCHEEISEELKMRLRSLPELTPEKFELTSLVVFEISLVPPSGNLLVVAKDFELQNLND